MLIVTFIFSKFCQYEKDMKKTIFINGKKITKPKR